jgi:hypothetical protein
MIHSVKDLSIDQKLAVESLLGRPVSDEEQISLKCRACSTNSRMA